MTSKTATQLNETGEIPPETLRVLLVDDNAPVLRFLASAVASNDCAATTASTAEQALELLGNAPFDLVVSDIKMPGLSGLDLLRAIKGTQPATPVVLITGVPSVNSAVFGLRHGLQRRQGGVEVLSSIGELALQGLEPARFIEKVLEKTLANLRCDAAIMVLSDQEGKFNASRMGQPAMVGELLTLLHAHFADVVKAGGRETYALTNKEHGFEALAALIPGVGDAVGILCMGRDARTGAFLPDEKGLLLGYAQPTAVALQKIVLREQIEKNLVDTISSFVIALESKDPYLKGHSARVSLYTGEIAKVMGMPTQDVVLYTRAGLLHDLGKLVMLDNILRKPRQLTEEEFEIVRSHPVVGDKILKPLRFLSCEAKAVRHHHERYDGKGYPDGIQGEAIPLIARVVTVADAFDAMTSDRPYRAKRPIAAAIDEISRGARTQFDPVIAEVFVTIPPARLKQISRQFDLRPAEAPGAAVRSLADAE